LAADASLGLSLCVVNAAAWPEGRREFCTLFRGGSTRPKLTRKKITCTYHSYVLFHNTMIIRSKIGGGGGRVGEAAGSLLRWLNALPETLAMMAAKFASQPINEPNLPAWRQWGLRDWKAQQLPLEAMDGVIEDASQLPAASKGWRAKTEVQKSNLIQVNPG
jgi:hypothetical protein